MQKTHFLAIRFHLQKIFLEFDEITNLQKTEKKIQDALKTKLEDRNKCV